VITAAAAASSSCELAADHRPPVHRQ
jgi:hypothetical protein